MIYSMLNRYLVLLFVSTAVLFANGLHFEHNFDKAMQKAQNQNKEVMMMYSATWCPECNYVKEVVFKDKRVIKYINKHFVLLGLDIQKDKLPKGFNYMGIPTFFFINKDKKQTGEIVGGDKAGKFLKELKDLK